jgi:hypothetical protein
VNAKEAAATTIKYFVETEQLSAGSLPLDNLIREINQDIKYLASSGATRLYVDRDDIRSQVSIPTCLDLDDVYSALKIHYEKLGYVCAFHTRTGVFDLSWFDHLITGENEQ